jgi:predicted DNA-binding transcriptional regulator YafY
LAEQVTFSFEAEWARRADEASEMTARIIWLLLAFIREREVSYPHYHGIFGRRERTFKRDIAKLRELGARYGFKLTGQRKKLVRLVHFDGAKRIKSGDPAAAEAVRALSDAFGEVVAASLRDVAGLDGTNLDRFLRVAAPRLVRDTDVAATYRELREAWRARARVRFQYPVRGETRLTERVVEPHAVSYLNGRYYLIGFDARARGGGWRQFALDRVAGPIARAGSFALRVIPEQYRGEDAVGLFKTGLRSEATVEFSPAIAPAVCARRWQRGERVERRPDGSATLTLVVYDLAEAVRWAFSFGTEARVVAPPAAVELARAMSARLAESYEAAPAALRGVS